MKLKSKKFTIQHDRCGSFDTEVLVAPSEGWGIPSRMVLHCNKCDDGELLKEVKRDDEN